MIDYCCNSATRFVRSFFLVGCEFGAQSPSNSLYRMKIWLLATQLALVSAIYSTFPLLLPTTGVAGLPRAPIGFAFVNIRGGGYVVGSSTGAALGWLGQDGLELNRVGRNGAQSQPVQHYSGRALDRKPGEDLRRPRELHNRHIRGQCYQSLHMANHLDPGTRSGLGLRC